MPVPGAMRFDGLAEEIQEAALQATTDAAAEAAETARGTMLNLPPHMAAGYYWGGYTPRREEAVASTPAKMSGGQITAQMGSEIRRGDYALMLERMRPYLRPAFDQAARTLASRIREILEES